MNLAFASAEGFIRELLSPVDLGGFDEADDDEGAGDEGAGDEAADDEGAGELDDTELELDGQLERVDFFLTSFIGFF